MIKRYKKKQDNRRFYRVNERIFAQTLRVLDYEGKQIGILPRYDAINRAKELGLDLVEIAPKAVPPVAKIIDFKKFLYQEGKKKREEKKKAKSSETKEIRLGPFMSDHDLGVMVKRSRDFLENGNKLRLVVRFIGRQITHPEFGERILEKVLAQLSGLSKVEREKHFEGKQLIIMLSPERKKNVKKENQKEDQKINKQEV